MHAHAHAGHCGPGTHQRRKAHLAEHWSLMKSRGGPWGFGGPGGPFGGPPPGFGPRGPRGPRARRGDVRIAALLLLNEEPRNGYAIMQELASRTEGLWTPSPGSVYPALSQLEDEGLIRTDETDGRKVFTITDAGRQVLAERPEDAPAPWDVVSQGADDKVVGLFDLVRQVGMATHQVAQAGDEKQVAQATELLTEVRKRLYKLLAGD